MVKINLLPYRENRRKRERTNFLIYGLALLSLFIVAAVGVYWYYSDYASSLEHQKTIQQAKLNDLKKKNKEIEDLKNRIDRLKKQVETIQKLTKTRDSPAPFMSALSLAMPGEVWVSAISKTGKSFSLDGTGVDNTVVINFVQNLQKVREGFTEKQPWVNPANPKEKTFFANVKLVQVVTAGGAPGSLGAMSFKVVGSLR
jgi:type IV pilus assembly protein PilN